MTCMESILVCMVIGMRTYNYVEHCPKKIFIKELIEIRL
jgi:hypothetical protein